MGVILFAGISDTCVHVGKEKQKDRLLSHSAFEQHNEWEASGLSESVNAVRKPQYRDRGGEGKARHDSTFALITNTQVSPTLNSFPTQNFFSSCSSPLLPWYPRAKASHVL